MVSQMANPQHGELDLTRGKESSIWALKLPKELRHDEELASTYLLELPTQRKSCFKTSPPLVLFFLIFEELLPRVSNGLSGGGRRESIAFDDFLGQVRGWAVPGNPFVGAAHPLTRLGISRDGSLPTRPWKWRPFIEAGKGVTRLYKWISRDGLIATVTAPHL